MPGQVHEKSRKGALVAAVLFYLLIAFEFLYMASPFAAYFYSVYRPGLNFLHDHPQLAWLSGFFLPHVVAETSSTLINIRNEIGALFAVVGFVSFCAGAAHVYYCKLAGKGPVTWGIYRRIRHPQYLSLSVCGFGMLLLWPRLIVLFGFVTMLFAYYLLARMEEKECLSRFGAPYLEYMNRTGMFLPVTMRLTSRLPSIPASRTLRGLGLFGVYSACLLAAYGVAIGLQRLSVNSLYSYSTKDSATISISKMERGELKRLVETALADETVRQKLALPDKTTTAKFLNYVLPQGWSVSEIPMRPIKGNPGHVFRRPPKNSVYRIVFTRAVLRDRDDASGMGILLHTLTRVPLAEVVVDAEKGAVVRIEDPVAKAPYQNVPLPLY